MSGGAGQYASRGGVKLAAALEAFPLPVEDAVCCDLGSHAGGFVDCLLRAGAQRVYAVDTGYGVLDYRLRRDPRVVVCERTNALDFVTPEWCDLVTIDVGWTQLRLVLPAARRCLKTDGRVIALVKPQYEAPREWLRGGVVPANRLAAVLARVESDVGAAGWECLRRIDSPIRGHGGNLEQLWMLRPPAS